MKINKSTLYLALAIVATACTDESPEAGTNAKQVSAEITAGIAGVLPETSSPAADTRASDTNWHAGDAIGLYMLQTGTNTISRNMANLRYINSATGITANFAPDGEGNTAYYPSGGEEVDIIAYYPHNGQLVMDNGQLTVPVDVSNQSNLPAIDLMTSNLSVGHSSDEDKRAARLNFTHRLSKIVLNLKKGKGTERLNLADATVTIGGTPATAVWDLMAGNFTSRGAATDIELNMNGGRTTGILIPPGESSQTGSDAVPVTFTIVAGTEIFTATLPADKPLGSGKQLDITIRLEHFESTIETEITDWITGTETTENAINIVQPPSSTGLPVVTTFDLWRINTPNDIRTYTWNDVSGKWTATPEPFYIEPLMAGEMFQARYTLSTDPLTDIDDIIETPATPLKDDYTLALDFSHTNAQVALTLATADDFPAVDWSQAAVKILGYETVLSGASHTFIMSPGEIATGTTLAQITVNNITYKAVVNTAIALDAGTTAVVEIELQPTEASIVTVSYQPWTPVSGGELNAVNVYTPQFSNTTQAQTMTINKVGSTSSYSYTWNAGKWIPNGKALYIENIDDNDTFTATAVLSTDDVTGVEDIIEAPAVELVKSALAFNFTHVNAKLTIDLRAGVFTEAQLKAALLTLAINNDENRTSTGKLQHDFIFKPGTNISTGQLLATIQVAGINYEVKAISNISFEKNYKTTVSVIIEGTQPGINVKTEPWLTSSGSGTVTNTDVTANTDLSKLPGNGTITLTSGSKNAMYRYEGGNLTSNVPLYWEDFVKYSTGTTLARYKFSFRYVPDALTGIAPDILYQDDVEIEWGESLTFDNLLHKNAEIVIVFEKGSTYGSDDIDWSTARVKLSGFTPSYLILTANEENKKLVTIPVVVTESTSATSKFIHLELNNINYKIEMNALGILGNTLEGGNSYRLTLTVDKTKIVMGVVNIKNFTPADGSGSIEYND